MQLECNSKVYFLLQATTGMTGTMGATSGTVANPSGTLETAAGPGGLTSEAVAGRDEELPRDPFFWAQSQGQESRNSRRPGSSSFKVRI